MTYLEASKRYFSLYSLLMVSSPLLYATSPYSTMCTARKQQIDSNLTNRI